MAAGKISAKSTTKRPRKLDANAVRDAARGRWPEILAVVGGLEQRYLSTKHGPCPKCGGKDRYRMLDATAGALICNRCFADRNGDGFAAVQWLRGCDFLEALKLVAQHLHLGDGNGSPPPNPAQHLQWREWRPQLAAIWCAVHKPGCTPEAMLAAGAKLATYRQRHLVFALPVWGPRLQKAPPVGWALYDASGGKLPKWSKDQTTGELQTQWVKTKLTYGSQPGFLGPVEKLAAAEIVWKVEGVTDMLAAVAAIQAVGSPSAPAIAITNANGCGEVPAAWMLNLLAGKKCRVLHDADEPGQRGAIGHIRTDGTRRDGWVQEIARTASECRHVQLPYEIVKDHGRDLRNWIVEGHDYAALEKLAETATVETPKEPPGPVALKADDDPHRLAKVNLATYATLADGGTLRFWRDRWYTWKLSRGCYRRISENDLRAKMSVSIENEFNRLNIEAQAAYANASAEEKKSGPPRAKKVSPSLITSVIEATMGLALVPSSVELMTWLDGETRQRCNYIALKNGILNLDALLQGEDDFFLEHSPRWFSTVCLPYEFNSNAKCDRWLEFLNQSLEGDQALIRCLQEWCGYLLTPNTDYQKFLLLKGEGGNGKGVFNGAVTAMLGGENVSNITLEVFGDRFSRTDTIGKLAVICGDSDELDRVAEGYIKSFTSGDRMYFDRKGVEGVNCVPTARLIVACNDLPRIRDRSEGIWRRMLIVPFNRGVAEEEKIRGMDKPHWWEASGELPGILNWAIAGLHRLTSQKGFTQARASLSAMDDYKRESNSARAFLSEFVTEDPISGPGAFVRVDWLYVHYVRWAKFCNQHPFSKAVFGKEVCRVFKNVKRGQLREDEWGSKNVRHWVYWGIELNTDEICGEKTSDPIHLQDNRND